MKTYLVIITVSFLLMARDGIAKHSNFAAAPVPAGSRGAKTNLTNLDTVPGKASVASADIVDTLPGAIQNAKSTVDKKKPIQFTKIGRINISAMVELVPGPGGAMLAIPYPRGSGGTPQKGTLNPGLTSQIAGKSKVPNPNDPTTLLALNGGNFNGMTTFTTDASLAEMGVVTDTVSYYVPATAKTQDAINKKDLSERPQNFLLKKVEGGSGNLYAVVGGGGSGMNEAPPK